MSIKLAGKVSEPEAYLMITTFRAAPGVKRQVFPIVSVDDSDYDTGDKAFWQASRWRLLRR